MTVKRGSGWEKLAEDEDGATVIAGLLSLDSGREYSRSELADAAGIPLKTLYLVDTLEDLEQAGMLDRVNDVGDDQEAHFVIDEDSDIYQAALAFDRAFDND